MAIGGQAILDSETLSCHPGSMTALIGPSGSGKTTLLHCLGLLLPIDRGHIVIDGHDVTRYGAAAQRRFWRDHAAFVLQDYGLMDEESVAFNVTMRTGFLGRRRGAGDQRRMERALEQTGLAGRLDEPAGRLSGGEKQRLALARAIYKEAKILFADEPTASLDAANRKVVINLFAGFAESGCTVIVSTHDTEMIEACARQHEVTSGRPPGLRADP
ncbi:ATP-binding cassette domain-containing protein [Kitasatospora sp. NPDC002227]|uniref:ABC transporter ATP-binding protein n=1 Tax=Kitasatospora sp. NPDC002227 TaxID=3154773 RepID=UPI003323D194